MDDRELDAIKLHVAGATVRHTPPFDSLVPYKNSFDLSQDFIDKWVSPFYLYIGQTDEEWIKKLTSIKCELTEDIILTNLGDFNWRTRQTGAFFAAITNLTKFIDIIGIHLLKSEVSFAGGVYCRVLASFGLTKCTEYLNLYLDYYLTKPDLWFDQREAMEAILYLDKLNGTNHFEKHLNNWLEFIKNKLNWSKKITIDNLERQLAVIETVKKYAC